MTGVPPWVNRWVPHFVKVGAAASLFTFRKYVVGFPIPAKPHLDEPGLRYLRDVLSHTSCYLEYGVGGSTVLASQSADIVIAVESDSRMLAAVHKALSASNRRPRLSKLIHVDIGVTLGWGRPLFTRPTPARMARWENYARAPWDFLRMHAIDPDTILIDGRFRVACALLCLLNLEDRSPCLMLIDDYGNRPYYGVVTEFADLDAMHGSMAAFHRKATFDGERCRQILQSYASDWR
jgi:hypothetical protein